MSYRPTQDRHSKRKSRTIERFAGVHYGISKEKQPNRYAAICDFRLEEEKPVLRPGMRKNQGTGFAASISSLFPIHLGGLDWTGYIQDGTLSAQPATDILTGVRQYYIWDEVRRTWTVDTLDDAKTWHTLMTTRQD